MLGQTLAENVRIWPFPYALHLASSVSACRVASIPWRCFHPVALLPLRFAVPSDSPIMGVCTCVCTLHGWEYGTESQACPAVAF